MISPYDVDGNTHDYEGEIVLLHIITGAYKISHSNWVGDGLVTNTRSGTEYYAFQSTLDLGYTHWLPLDRVFGVE